MVKPDWEDTRRRLIDTYKTLNMDVRNKTEDELARDRGGESVKAVIRKMKDDELYFAKALTRGLTGEILGDEDSDEPPVIGNEVANETGNILISQFGSARATTLNALQGAPDEAWDRTFDGNKRLLDLAQELVERDQANMEKIRRMIGA